MKPNSYQSYPNGFRSPVFGNERMTINADGRIQELMTQWKNGLVEVDTWAFRAELIEVTRALFGDLLAWLDAQDHNPYISKTAYNLIVETIEFIKGKRRVISLPTTFSLIHSEVKSGIYRNDAAERRTERLRNLVDFDSRDYIFLWSQQPKGMHDMLCVTHFIFGPELNS